jgi:hypothetical protein
VRGWQGNGMQEGGWRGECQSSRPAGMCPSLHCALTCAASLWARAAVRQLSQTAHACFHFCCQGIEPAMVASSGDEVTVEMVTHHAGEPSWLRLLQLSMQLALLPAARPCCRPPADPTPASTSTLHCAPTPAGDDYDKMIKGDPGVEDIYRCGGRAAASPPRLC